MALQIWLPLNGDLHNQGLNNNITATNNGAIINNNGKIGKCYSFDGSSQKISTSISPAITSAIGSLACWVKFSSLPSSSGWFCLMQLGALGGFAACRLGVYFEKATGINISINGSSTGANYQAYTFSTGVWYHICATYDGSKVKLYINGQEKMNKTATLGSYTTTASNLFIGGTNSYWMNGCMNDIRYYNHALSPKEVEEIAKGLVLHYKLDQPNPNLILNSQNILINKLNSADGSRLEYTAINVGQSYMNLTNNQKVTISFDLTLKVGSPNITYFQIYNTNNKGPIQISMVGVNSQIAKLTQGATVGDIVKGKIKSTHTITVRTDANKTDNFIEFYSQYGSNNFYKIENLKMELGEEATPYCINNEVNTTIYDCSGYRNNGTIVGSLTTAAGSPRYNINTLFNGEDSCIQVPYNQACPENIFTINLWFCKDALGSKNYETLFGGPGGFEMDTRSGSATTLSLYMASTRRGNVFSPFNFNEWYMVTMVRDGTNELYYINGELKKTIEAKSMPIGNYFIGAWQTAVRQNYYGNMSDFRIYATALSAAAIKELYTTSLKIVSGNPVARELSEL